MKAIYLKPTVEFELLQDELMISASAGGTQIIEEGGNTSDEGITSGDARGGRFSTWEDQ